MRRYTFRVETRDITSLRLRLRCEIPPALRQCWSSLRQSKAKGFQGMNFRSTSRWPLRVLLVLLFMAAAGFPSFTRCMRAVTPDAAEAARHAYNEKIAAGYKPPVSAPPNIFCPRTQRPIMASSSIRRVLPPPNTAVTVIRRRTRSGTGVGAFQLQPAGSGICAKNVNLLTAEKGVEYTRHCEGCHDPIALFAGVLTQGGPGKRPYDSRTALPVWFATRSRRSIPAAREAM